MNTQHALPPYAEMLGVTLEPRDGAAPLLVMPFRNEVLGRPGFLHGGAISGLLEVAAIVSLQHALAEEGGGRIKPVNVTVDFMRGGRDKPTHAEGIVTRLRIVSPKVFHIVYRQADARTINRGCNSAVSVGWSAIRRSSVSTSTSPALR